MSDENDETLAAIALNHLQRLNEISGADLEKFQEIGEHASKAFRKYSGLKATTIEKLLHKVGVLPDEKPPAEPKPEE